MMYKKLLRQTARTAGKAALTGAMVVTAAAAFSSCDKDDGSSEGGVYIPDPNLTTAQIGELINNADRYTASTRKGSVTGIQTEYTGWDSGGVYKWDAFWDKNAKKKLSGGTITLQGRTEIVEIWYVDGTDDYEFDNECEVFRIFGGTTECPIKKTLTKVSTDADMYYYGFEFVGSAGVWEIKNGKIMGEKNHYGNSYVKCEITLDASKRYKEINMDTYNGQILEYTQQFQFVYGDVNFQFPNGFNFNKSDFVDERADYYRAKIIWGEGKGENTIWRHKNFDIDLRNITPYAPDVYGKEIKAYTINGISYDAKIQSDYKLTDNSTVIYAVWQPK